jgi:thermitase
MKTGSSFRKLGIIFLVLLSPILGHPHSAGQFAPNRIIVKLLPNVPVEILTAKTGTAQFNIARLDILNARYSCNEIRNIGSKRHGNSEHAIYLLEFTGNPDIPEVVKEYYQTGLLVYAEPDYKGYTQGGRVTDSIMPNDTYFSRQWSLYNDGSFSSPLPAKVGADIDMNHAWSVEQGDTTTVVGIIDTGLKLDHPEFSGRLWRNTGEIPGNGIDDDGNSYIDDINGWDFVNADNDPTDDEGHGTNVGGIIGANGNNAMGYAGVNWHCKLMILKGINSANWGYYSWWIDAIHYAVDNGAQTLNMSVCGTDVSSALQDGVTYAIQHNVSIIACMGNANNNIPNFPAAYAGVIAVGSTNPDDTRSNPFFWSTSSGSNYNSYISVVAPGNYIYGLDYSSNTSYNTYWGGTSQATPHVTGLVSLLLAQDNSRTPSSLKDILEKTAKDQVGDPVEDTPGWDQYYGWGRINAYSALTYNPASVNNKDNFVITLYPNPSHGAFSVQLNTQTIPKTEMIISNLFGQVVYQQQLVKATTSIDMPGFPHGIYTVTFISENTLVTKKLMLE